jgi:hypothetical protein
MFLRNVGELTPGCATLTWGPCLAHFQDTGSSVTIDISVRSNRDKSQGREAAIRTPPSDVGGGLETAEAELLIIQANDEWGRLFPRVKQPGTGPTVCAPRIQRLPICYISCSLPRSFAAKHLNT